jgi:hypothetical protein
MGWFRKDPQPDIWEIAGDEPLDDIAAAHRIRDICAAAGAIAEKMAAAGGRDAEKNRAVDAARYQAAIKCALEIAMKTSDDAMRDVSLGQIIRLSVKVDHLKTARVLVRAIKSEKTRAELMADHPVLRDQDAAN